MSTRGDVSSECITKIVKWAEKATVHAYVVTENGESGKLHLHAALVFKSPQKKVQMRNNIWSRYVQPYHPDSKGAVAVKLQAMPGHKWYDEYLRKEGGAQVLLDTYDRDSVDSYLPTEAEQASLIAGAKLNPLNSWWDKHVEGWTSSEFTDDKEGAVWYLYDCMHKNVIQTIKDSRIITDTAIALWRRRHNICAPSAHQLMLLRRDDQDYTYAPVGGGTPGDSKKMWKDRVFKEGDPPV